MLEVRDEGLEHPSRGQSWTIVAPTFSRLKPSMIKPPPDVPVAVVLLHLAALVALLLHAAVARLRRAILIRQGLGLPSSSWLRLLHVLLGLPQ